MENENNCCQLEFIAAGAVGVIIGLLISLYLPQTTIINSPITAQINLNSDGGILTINATFSNLMNGTTNWFTSYKINSATEELPNGTVIIPATSYVQKQIQIDCIKGIYLGNSNYYSC